MVDEEDSNEEEDAQDIVDNSYDDVEEVEDDAQDVIDSSDEEDEEPEEPDDEVEEADEEDIPQSEVQNVIDNSNEADEVEEPQRPEPGSEAQNILDTSEKDTEDELVRETKGLSETYKGLETDKNKKRGAEEREYLQGNIKEAFQANVQDYRKLTKEPKDSPLKEMFNNEAKQRRATQQLGLVETGAKRGAEREKQKQYADASKAFANESFEKAFRKNEAAIKMRNEGLPVQKVKGKEKELFFKDTINKPENMKMDRLRANIAKSMSLEEKTDFDKKVKQDKINRISDKTHKGFLKKYDEIEAKNIKDYNVEKMKDIKKLQKDADRTRETATFKRFMDAEKDAAKSRPRKFTGKLNLKNLTSKAAWGKALKETSKKGPVIGAQIGAALGFRRTGLVGDKVLQQQINRQMNKVNDRKNTIAGLTKMKDVKLKQAGEDGRITQNEEKDINQLMGKIGELEKTNDVENKILDKLQNEKAVDDKYQYMDKPTARQITGSSGGGTRVVQSGKNKGQTVSTGKKGGFGPFGFSMKGPKKSFLKGKKKQHLTKFEKDIMKAKIGKMKAQASEIADDDFVPPKPTKNNEFGVEDWIMKY